MSSEVNTPKISIDDCTRVFTEFTPMAAAMGVRCEQLGWGTCLVAMDANDDYVRPGGSVIGPAMMTLADVGMYVAIMTRIGVVPMAVTSNLNINFLNRPSLGTMYAESRVIKLGRRLAYGEVNIFAEGERERLAAHATVTYALPTT